MRKSTVFSVLCSLCAASIALPVEARINQRQAKQQQRIYNGVTSGKLNARETQRLVRQQAHIAQYEHRSRADGPGLTRTERLRLESMQDRASATIRREVGDSQRYR